MAISYGPNLGLMIDATTGEAHDAALRAFLRGVDGLVMPAVIDKDLNTPPGSPVSGDRYIVGPSPTGAWAGHAGKIARWSGSAWEFYTPANGWRVMVLDEGVEYRRIAGAWTSELKVGSKIWIGGTSTNSSDPVVNVNRDVDNSVAGNGHCFSDSSVVNRSGGIGYNSFDARITVTGSNNYNHFACFQSGPVYGSSGVCDNFYHFFSGLKVNGGTITNHYGFYITDPTGAGSIGANYGIYIPQLSKGSAANWGIYTAGTTPSRFGGTVSFSRLDVRGSSNDGSMAFSANAGLLLEGATGSSYDFALMNVGRSAYVFRVPTGTNNISFVGNPGFYGANPVAKQTVTGSRGSNAALASALTALANLGLFTDATTA